MNIKNNFPWLLLFYLSACKPAPPAEENDPPPRALVNIASVHWGDMRDQVSLQATSLYLKKNVVTAPVPCFVTRVNIKLGDQVSPGNALFELITKEGRALANQAVMQDSSLRSLGNITVKAPSQGIISTLDKQQGDYVLEGSPLCTIAESRNLAFQMNVPFEYNRFVKDGSACEILLPDNRRLQGTVSATLTTMNALAQTQQFIVKPLTNLLIPEGLIATVFITTSLKPHTQLLPKVCVLTDEVLQHFWVMQLLNDSTAVKVPIQPGLATDSTVEVLSPVFTRSDVFLSKGNYGLADTALVKVVKE